MRWSSHATIDIGAPRSTVYDVVAAVEELPSWLPPLAGTRVLAAEGDVRIVEITGPSEGRVVVELVESAPRSLLFTQVDRDRRRGISGEVRLEESHPGTVVRVRLTVPAPLWRPGVARRNRRSLLEALEALRRRCSREEPAPESRRLLSIRRRADGRLELWLEGAIYDMIPRPPDGEEPELSAWK